MALHEQSVGATDEWYTPPYIFNALRCSFDLDVASPGRDKVPWIPAVERFTEHGLGRPWHGFVWMNPPFGGRNGLVPWLEKFRDHGNGICLVPDRTSAPWWQSWARTMELVLFVAPKIKFIGADGKPGASPAQGTCLGGLGQGAREPLWRAAADGLGVLMMPAAIKRNAP
jgi:DNA N-6-adenine-methyltransferase Dam